MRSFILVSSILILSGLKQRCFLLNRGLSGWQETLKCIRQRMAEPKVSTSFSFNFWQVNRGNMLEHCHRASENHQFPSWRTSAVGVEMNLWGATKGCFLGSFSTSPKGTPRCHFFLNDASGCFHVKNAHFHAKKKWHRSAPRSRRGVFAYGVPRWFSNCLGEAVGHGLAMRGFLLKHISGSFWWACSKHAPFSSRVHTF